MNYFNKGNAIAKVKSKDPIKVLTVRGTAFSPVPVSDQAGVSPEAISESEKPVLTEWVGEELQKSDRPELGTATKVVSGGRALKSKENFDKLIFIINIILNFIILLDLKAFVI